MNWPLLLRLLLRFDALVMGLSIFAVFMPTTAMERISLDLGLEPLPDIALGQYLTRSLSLLYAAHATLFWVASTDLRRFAPIITTLAVLDLTMAVLQGGIDVAAGMPTFWTAGEIAMPGASGLLILFLQARIRRGPAAAGS